MANHEKFRARNREELQAKIQELGVNLPMEQDLSALAQQVPVHTSVAPNAFAILPMEGCDSNLDGSPSELVIRRYKRFFAGGAGLIWWEANAVVEEGKANEYQMMLTSENIDSFASLLSESKEEALKRNGYVPLSILQLTHSGRYSRPSGHAMKPIIPQHDPLLDSRVGIDESYPICTDEYLESLIPAYVHSALLAQQAGFDGVDIKACHRYLLSELLASHTREGKYGGSFENRIRLFVDIVKAVRSACGDDFIVASRFNIFDAHPHPYGFGCAEDDFWAFEEDEPIKLVQALVDAGVTLLSNSAGNPYYIHPQVTRPFDTSSMGVPVPDEHPLESIERLLNFTALVQKTAGAVPVVGNGYTWLRQFLPEIGSAALKAGRCQFVGLGRMAIAYPNAPRDVLLKGAMDPSLCCIACSKCTQIMRDHGMTGCVIRDGEIYVPQYKKAREEAQRRAENA